jgi:hypothetical protein
MDRSASVERLQAAMDLFETGVSLMRQNLRRAHPDADGLQIERLLHAWLTERPGARLGDSDGTPVDLRHR